MTVALTISGGPLNTAFIDPAFFQLLLLVGKLTDLTSEVPKEYLNDDLEDLPYLAIWKMIEEIWIESERLGFSETVEITKAVRQANAKRLYRTI